MIIAPFHLAMIGSDVANDSKNEDVSKLKKLPVVRLTLYEKVSFNFAASSKINALTFVKIVA
jgi:hypothetical protein